MGRWIMKSQQFWVQAVIHAACLASLSTLPVRGNAAPILSVSGGPITLFQGGERCGKYDFVDAPARAFRDNIGVVHMFAAGDHNRQFKGPDLLHARYDCAIAFKGGHENDPSAYNDYGWLSAFHTDDGKTVHALVHNEFHGSERPWLCSKPGSAGCWETDISAAVSHDSGNTFDRVPPPLGLVAALPYIYNSRYATQAGFFNPTNILFYRGFYYVFVAMINPVAGTSGMCLLRSKSMDEPKSWRAWNGSRFAAKFIDPYTVAVKETGVYLCQPVSRDNLFFGTGSISHFARSNVFFSVMRFNKWDKAVYGEVPGIYSSTSKDLLHWSVPSLVLSDQQAAASASVSSDSYEYYPSLLDPAASDRNFSEITNAPYLVTVQILHGQPNSARHLIAWPVQVRSLNIH